MPAEVIGFLREKATHGEKQVLDLLKRGLPKEYTVYVETPIHKKRDIRYPDFIVLTNYGVIVLEVKDWVTVISADPSGAKIRTRKGKERQESNPVNTAREFAITLSNELKRKLKQNKPGEAVPWSYAAILANQPYSVITQLRGPWGEEFVWGEDDLIVPDLLQKRLKMLFPAERMRSLTKQELDQIRAIIYPVVEIEIEGREPFVLDQQQEKIVAEPVRATEPTESSKKVQLAEQARLQEKMFENPEPEDVKDGLTPRGDRISRTVSIRLVRGFSGSGKTLVLMQRAKFLAAQYPEWKIAILTYNKLLQSQLESAFIGTSVQVRTFDSICQSMLRKKDDAFEVNDWLDWNKFDFPVIRALGVNTTGREINWLRDVGITDKDTYLKTTRHGIGQEIRLTKDQRDDIFEVYMAYRTYLRENNKWDWEDLRITAMEDLNTGKISYRTFDAILIDEAQDWAPTWLQVASKLLNPDHGLLFLADDPSQSIYRYFSWKEKGVSVVGRTRWLRVPYRNTYEIYQAAYSMIANHQEIQNSLSESGELVKPDLTSSEMRHGAKPLVRRCHNSADELAYIKNTVDTLRRDGFRDEQIAILARYRNDLEPIKNAMKGYDVMVNPIHSFKGLEMEVVFIPHLHKTFSKEGEDFEATERRLLYMALTRARSQLFLTYSGKLPKVYEQLREAELADFLG